MAKNRLQYRITWRAMLHWISMALLALLATLAAPWLVAYAGSQATMSFVPPLEELLTAVIFWSGLLLAGYNLAAVIYHRLAYRYIVDRDNVAVRSGIIARKVLSIRHRHIRSIEVRQSIMERLLGVGNVEMASAATGDTEVKFRWVASPTRIKEEIEKWIQSNQQPEVEGE
ncbi:PH domain-containing protein [Desulfurivibrio sp. D14AmB]|uniref:PH domain-containing protein n=1 Tax=Desulfurivibrio sp. D14AmB TaxID=3374370 RepID=UPI00376F4307